MTRSEYLMALYDALNDIPAEDRTEIVSEYRDFFDSELAKGRTEEEICISLGDPVTLAYAIKQRRGYGKPPKQPPVKRGHPGSFRAVRIIMGVFIAMAVFSILGFSVTYEIGRGIFGIGEKYDVDNYKDIDPGSAESIKIQVKVADTIIKVSPDNKVHASLKGSVWTTSEKAVPKLEVFRDGSSLIIREQRESLSITHFSGSLNLDISIPEDFRGRIIYEGAAGNLTSYGLELDSLHVKLTSGDIRLEDIALDDDLSIVSSSGNINIEKLKAKEAYIKSSSGDKKLKSMTVRGDVTFISSSGNNYINDMECDSLSVNSTSGDTTINGLNGGLNAKSTSGNVSVTLEKLIGSIDISVLSGNTELRIPSYSDFTIDCSVASGDIDCDFDLDDEHSGKQSLRGSHGAGTYPINIKTTSGNIRIRD